MSKYIDYLNKKNKLLTVKILGERIKQTMMIGFFLIAVLFMVLSFMRTSDIIKGKKIGPNSIAVLNINKTITDEYVSTLIDNIDQIVEEKKPLIIRMNSGGGSPSASDDFADYLKDVQKKIKVYMYIQNMAASGAYYIASSADIIYANKNAIVGSIGVIMPHFKITDLANKIGIKEDNIAVGKHKSPISMFKPTTKEQEKYLKQNLLNPTYENFVQIIANNRGFPVQEIKSVADGKIFVATSKESQNYLIDEITTFNKVRMIAKADLLKKNPLVLEEEVSFYDVNLDKKKGLFSGLGVNLNISFDQQGKDFLISLE